MKRENSTVQLINRLVKAAGMHRMLIMILWLLKKKNRPTKDLLHPSGKPAFYHYYWPNQKVSQASPIKNLIDCG